MKPTYIIAEIGQAHEGSLGILHSYIDAAAQTGVDAVKFQTHIAAAESSAYEPFRTNFSYEDATRFDYWKRMEFSLEQWQGIKGHCEEKGLDFISTPFSNAAVDLLEALNVDTYKIGSGDASNFLLLEKIAETGKKIILSSGMSCFAELDQSVYFLKSRTSDLAVLQCTTQYPTAPEDIGLNLILELSERYGLPVGLSDHSGSMFPCLSAVTLGAEIVEFHLVFDRLMFGPDSSSSLTIDETKTLTQGIRFIEAMRNSIIDKNQIDKFQELRSMFGKSLAVNKPLAKGHILTFNDLEGKKPLGCGIDAKEFKNVIGKKLKNFLNQWDFIKEEDIND